MGLIRYFLSMSEIERLAGGEGGIRTLGTFDSTPDFESGTFDHSATSPNLIYYSKTAVNTDCLSLLAYTSGPNEFYFLVSPSLDIS